MKNTRCFGDGDPTYEKYHDEEWGIPVHDDTHLFEMLILEGAQAGLSWKTILMRREGYRTVFHSFDPLSVAKMSDEELDEACKNPAVIRNRRKIYGTRQNAQVFLNMQKEFGSFDHYLWKFVDRVPIIGNWKCREEVPTHTKISDAIAKDLKKRGMTFVGTTIIYAYMQAVGMVNDHLITCPSCKKMSIGRH